MVQQYSINSIVQYTTVQQYSNRVVVGEVLHVRALLVLRQKQEVNRADASVCLYPQQRLLILA